MRHFLAEGQIVVIETEDDWFLGTAEMAGGNVIVRSGFVGRPVVLEVELIRSIIPAQGHPDVAEDSASAPFAAAVKNR